MCNIPVSLSPILCTCYKSPPRLWLALQAVPFSGGQAAFANYSQVFVPYCSGDLWLGDLQQLRALMGQRVPDKKR